MHKHRKWTSYLSKRNIKKRIKSINKSTDITLKNNKKRLLITICFSLFIGIIFGLITLKMLKQEDIEHGNTLQTGTEVQREDRTEEKMKEFEPINIFVIQGGVFSEEENAKSRIKQFEKLHFPAISWERDGTYYIFSGMYTSEEKAKQFVKEMDAQGLEVYVKEWDINVGKQMVTEMDYNWIQTFVDIWYQSLKSLDISNDRLDEEWNNLIDSSHQLSQSFSDLRTTIREMINQSKSKN